MKRVLSGLVAARELRSVKLGKTGDHVPTLSELLERVDGKVGLVLELKGIFGEDEGFVAAVLKTLSQYKGDVAIMSFNHWLLARCTTARLTTFRWV